MVTLTLNQIVNNILLKRKYPIHYYLEFLLYAKEGLRESAYDELHLLNTKKIPINSYNAIDLPNDYVDYCSVNLQFGQKLRPLVPSDTLNPLHNFDSNFNIVEYSSTNTDITLSNPLLYGNVFLAALWLTTTYNSYGEATGKFFGYGAGNPTDTFRVVKERNQIQLNEGIVADNIILCYIGDGSDADSASQIDPYAQSMIDAYAMWKFKENNRTYGQGEVETARQEYIRQRKI